MRDGLLFVAATALGGVTTAELWPTHGPLRDRIDLVVGMLACLTLWARRARPWAVALAAVSAAAFSPMAGGAALVALGTAASRLAGRRLALVAVAAVLCSVSFPVTNPRAGEILTVGFPAFLVTVIAFGGGLYVRARRELVDSLRERAERLEADRERGLELAREGERRRIAREMHDALAHRLSLVSVHAGALEFHTEAGPGEIARSAGVIRLAAADALRELRQVITLLREDSDAVIAPPQPALSQLPALLQESREAGMTVRARLELPDAQAWPAAVQRAAYRVVQEGLTNARKHAPGSAVEVTLTTDARARLVVQVISQPPAGDPPRSPNPGADGRPAAPDAGSAGSGSGLIGLTERLTLLGGELRHGYTATGAFLVCASIPGCP